jgi:succinate dehydrogenase/fumarate reductase-like Fe-S protein
MLIERDAVRKATAACICLCVLTGVPAAAQEQKDYAGPFPTPALYRMCSDPASRDKCRAYLQGLMYGLNAQKSMYDRGSPVCLPDITPEAARIRLLQFIDTTTRGKPSSNKDSGDWVAFLALAAGNLCKK